MLARASDDLRVVVLTALPKFGWAVGFASVELRANRDSCSKLKLFTKLQLFDSAI